MALIESFISMWPRELFHLKRGSSSISEFKEILEGKPGIYVLHKGNEVFYVGKAGKKGKATGCLFSRIQDHDHNFDDDYHSSWNCFSVFIITEEARPMIDELERILQFTCLDSANKDRTKPGKQIKLPKNLNKMLKENTFIDVRSF